MPKEALFGIGSAAVESLVGALEDSDGSVRYHAAETLERIGDARAAEPLLEYYVGALDDSDSSVRDHAAAALERIWDVRAAEPLIRALNDRVCQMAAGALGKIGDASAVESLLQYYIYLLKHGEGVGISAGSPRQQEVRASAAWPLAKIGNARAVEPLCDALRDSSPRVRSAAAAALIRVGDTRAVEPLIEALKDSFHHVRKYAAQALENIGDVRAIGQLIWGLGSGDEVWVRGIDRGDEVREACARALVNFGSASVEPLIGALNDSVPEVRYRSIRLLENSGDPRAVEPVIGALNDTDAHVRRTAAETLQKIGDPRAAEPFIAALVDSDETVRRIAAEMLGKIGDARAAAPLVAALQDESIAARVYRALESLLERNAGTITQECLHTVASMQESVLQVQIQSQDCGGFTTSHVPVYCTHVKQLARQELIRRGFGA